MANGVSIPVRWDRGVTLSWVCDDGLTEQGLWFISKAICFLTRGNRRCRRAAFVARIRLATSRTWNFGLYETSSRFSLPHGILFSVVELFNLSRWREMTASAAEAQSCRSRLWPPARIGWQAGSLPRPSQNARGFGQAPRCRQAQAKPNSVPRARRENRLRHCFVPHRPKIPCPWRECGRVPFGPGDQGASILEILQLSRHALRYCHVAQDPPVV